MGMITTVDIIYVTLNEHLTKSLIFHSQLADYFRFLCLEKYACMQEEAFSKELKNLNIIKRNYISLEKKIVNLPENFSADRLIPEEWYRLRTDDITDKIKRQSVKTAMELWYNWEKDAMHLYSDLIGQLTSLGECTTYNILIGLYTGTMEEFDVVRHYMHKLINTDYNLEKIIDENEHLLSNF